jgi:hypothetical protein
MLQAVSGDSRFSALAGVAALSGFNKPPPDEQNHFEFGLQRLLDGIEAFVRARAARRRQPDRRRRTRARRT